MSDKKIGQADAIKILIKAAQIAQSKGCFTFEQSSTIFQAISTFLINNDEQVNTDIDDSEHNVNNTESTVNLTSS